MNTIEVYKTNNKVMAQINDDKIIDTGYNVKTDIYEVCEVLEVKYPNHEVYVGLGEA